MPKLSDFAVNPTLSEEGVWVEYGAKLYVKLARAGRPAYNKKLQALARPRRHMLRRNTDPDGGMTPLIKQTIAETCVMDWGTGANGQRDVYGRVISDAEDMLAEDGSVIACTYENCMKIFEDSSLTDFYNFIQDFVTEEQNFREQDLADAAENS